MCGQISGAGDARDRADGISEAMTGWAAQWAKTAAFAAAFETVDAADSTDAGRHFSDSAAELAGAIGDIEAAQFAADRRSASTIYPTTRLAILVALVWPSRWRSALATSFSASTARCPGRVTASDRVEHVLRPPARSRLGAGAARGVLAGSRRARGDQRFDGGDLLDDKAECRARHDAARLVAEAERRVTNANGCSARW